MYNARVQRRQSRKRSCRRNRKMYGAGAGLSYAFGPSVDPSNPGLGNGATVIPFSSCGNVPSSGRIHDTGTMGGVPGFGSKMYGGSRSMSDPIDALLKLAGQTGGGYTTGAVVGPNPFMNRPYSGCGEGAFSVRNPLNETVPSTLTAPPALKGGRKNSRRNRRMNGGAAVDAMIYQAPNAGYTFAPSNSAGGRAGTLSNGQTPFQVAVPYTAQPSASSACLKTGGRRRSRKNRKNSRKNRRNSRRN